MGHECGVAEDFASGRRKVELMFTDVDGTLLDPEQKLRPKVKMAVEAAARARVPLILATGKALGPWIEPVLQQLEITQPRVHMQGLYILGADGQVLFNRGLDEDVFDDTLAFCREHGLTFTAYLPDRVFCEQTNADTDRLIFYGEPTPESVGPWEKAVTRLGKGFNKLLLLSTPATMERLRPQLHERLGARAEITSALPGMLEILPHGASKGAGCEWLLERLGVSPAVCMAMGDGENDVEMLNLVGLGIAMGNAVPKAREAADAVTGRNSEDGVAMAIEKYVLAPRGLSL